MDSRWVIYGSMGGLKPEENVSLVKPLLKRSSILFSTLKSRSNDYKANLVAEMFKVIVMAKSRNIDAVAHNFAEVLLCKAKNAKF